MAPSPVTVPIFVSTMTFFVIVLLFVGLYQIQRQRTAKRSLLKKVRVSTSSEETLIEGAGARSSENTRRSLLGLLGSIGKHVAPEESEDYSRLRRNLVSAGLRFTPRLRFRYDEAFASGQRLEGILRTIRPEGTEADGDPSDATEE